MFVHAKDGNLVQLYWLPQKNEFQSAQQGHVVFDKLLMIKVVSPGMTAQEPHFWVEHHYSTGGVKRNELMFRRYGDIIEEYKANNGNVSERGYPIDTWEDIDVAQKEMLKHHRVYTVEALANLSDTACQEIGLGGRDLRQKAEKFLGRQKEGGVDHAERLARLEAENRALMEQVRELNARQNEEIIQRRGPGRPPKAEAV